MSSVVVTIIVIMAVPLAAIGHHDREICRQTPEHVDLLQRSTHVVYTEVSLQGFGAAWETHGPSEGPAPPNEEV